MNKRENETKKIISSVTIEQIMKRAGKIVKKIGPKADTYMQIYKDAGFLLFVALDALADDEELNVHEKILVSAYIAQADITIQNLEGAKTKEALAEGSSLKIIK